MDSVEQLLVSNPRTFEDRRKRGAFYAQSWLLTHYMFMDADAGGADWTPIWPRQRKEPRRIEALQTHLGHTPGSLEAALKTYLRGTMNYAPKSAWTTSVRP